jgi:hypothetical protein
LSNTPRYSWNVVEPMQRISPGAEQRLEQVGGVHHPARGGTGADDRVDLVDEQDRVLLFLQLREQALEALLEIAAVLGAREQRTQVERVDHAGAQHVGHLAVDDALGQPLGDRGLAHPGFADQQRIVLAPAREDLRHALELRGTPDQRIDAPGAGLVVEVGRETLQRARLAVLALLLLLARLGPAGARGVGDLGYAMGDVVDDIDARDVLLLQQVHRLALLFAEQRDQHIGARHLVAPRGLHVKHRALQHALEAERGLGLALGILLRNHRRRGLDEFRQLAAQLDHVRAAGPQHLARGIVVQQRQQQVLDRHELVSTRPRPLEGGVEIKLQILAQHDKPPAATAAPISA